MADGLANLPPGFTIQAAPASPAPQQGVDTLPPGFTIQKPEPGLGERFTQGAADVTQQLMGDIAAAGQRTSPIVRTAEGGLNRELAPEDDQFLFAEQGVVRPGRVALQDPATGQVRVFLERPETQEGILPSAGRVIGVGALTSPVSRVPGGVAGAADAAMATAPAIPAAAQRSRAAAAASQAAQPGAADLAGDFIEAGVDPTLGAVSQGRTARMAENVLTENIASGGIMQRARERSLEQTAAAAGDLARRFGAAESPAEGGRAAIRGGKAFVDRFQTRANELYSRIDGLIPVDQEFPVFRSVRALREAASRFDNPELAQQFVDPALKRWGDIITTSGGKLSWNDLQSFRSEVGRLLRRPVVVADVDRAQLNRLYGALSDDMTAAAKSVSPEALKATNRANQFYRAGIGRINNALDDVLKPGAQETAVFEGLLRTAGEKGAKASAQKLRSISRSMTRDEWGEVASSVINQLGLPPPSARTGLGAANFSPSTFVTNYAKLADESKDVLFNRPGQKQLRTALDRLVRVTEAQKNVERLANPSGTGRIAVNTALGALTLADPVSGLGTALGAATAAGLMTNPKIVNWLVNIPKAAKRGGRRGGQALLNRRTARHIAELRQIGRDDPELEAAVNTWADAINDRRLSESE